jgi:hypothetical protein
MVKVGLYCLRAADLPRRYSIHVRSDVSGQKAEDAFTKWPITVGGRSADAHVALNGKVRPAPSSVSPNVIIAVKAPCSA